MKKMVAVLLAAFLCAVAACASPPSEQLQPTSTRATLGPPTTTALAPTLTATLSLAHTPELPTATPTDTPVPPTATATDTPVPPTATPTDTPVPPTATPTDTPVPPTATPTHTPVPSEYYVSPDGSDSRGDGSLENPWRTAAYALDNVPLDGGFTVFLLDGEYPDQITTGRSFASPVLVRALNDYRAVLVNTGQAPISLYGFEDEHRSFNLTFSGLEIKGLGAGPQGYALVYLWKADDVAFRNCIIHDSYNDDLMRVLHSARISVKNSVFYNPEAKEEAIDINGGSKDVVVEGSIFFNEYAASGRQETSPRPFVLIKTSWPDEDGITRRVTIERNLFLHKNTDAPWQSMVHVGGDDKDYYTAQNVTVQNNLFAAADGPVMGKAVRVLGSRDVFIFANTMRSAAGSFLAMGEVARESQSPICVNVQFANNLFLDEAGEGERLIQGDGTQIESGLLRNNLYWWGAGPPPVTAGDYFNYTDDARAIVKNPRLPAVARLTMPVWGGEQFAGGYRTIGQIHADLVQALAAPGRGSPVVDAASVEDMPRDDITGQPRDGAPDVGAYEVRP